jgi:putative mRNA 3-end processing factor
VDLLTPDGRGLLCAPGGFHVDPWAPVPQAVVTHAHGDHARPGSGTYWCSVEAEPFLRRRVGPEASVRALAWGERVELADAVVSVHPSGHVRGAAQVRVESKGAVWVVSGDYKRAADPTCSPFEVVPCDVFVTESTFGLPVYRWPDVREVVEDVLAWWDGNRAAGRPALLYCYAVGKAQRLLAELARLTDRPVLVHGAVETACALYRQAGVPLLPTRAVDEGRRRGAFAGELVLAPPSARGTPWARRFGDHESAQASGWMRVRGTRRRRSLDRGFVLSDHADWPALLRTVSQTGARRVRVVHGYAEELAGYLREQGFEADAWSLAPAGAEDPR